MFVCFHWCFLWCVFQGSMLHSSPLSPAAEHGCGEENIYLKSFPPPFLKLLRYFCRFCGFCSFIWFHMQNACPLICFLSKCTIFISELVRACRRQRPGTTCGCSCTADPTTSPSWCRSSSWRTPTSWTNTGACASRPKLMSSP